MQSLDFDVLGIEEEGVVSGCVELSSLGGGPCRAYQRTFHPSELVAESTPLIQLLATLRNKPRVFVLDGNRVNGIVTRGDLQKAPVRMLLFGLITFLEMHLLRLVRLYYPDGSWQSHLSDGRLQLAAKLLTDRQARNEAIDLADCLQFCDKRDLLLKRKEIWQQLGFQHKQQGHSLLERVELLRNRLAHAQDLVVGSTWPALIDLAGEIQAVLERCEGISDAIPGDQDTAVVP
jgi:hypothetical protein